MYKISRIADTNIFPNVVIITFLMFNPYTILYNSAIKILYIIYLPSIKDSYKIFALLATLVKKMI